MLILKFAKKLHLTVYLKIIFEWMLDGRKSKGKKGRNNHEYCYGANETWGMRIHMQGFILRHGQNTGRVGQWQTDITQTRQRVVLRQAWVDDRRIEGLNSRPLGCDRATRA